MSRRSLACLPVTVRLARDRLAQRLALRTPLVGRHELGFCVLVDGRFFHDGRPRSVRNFSHALRQVSLILINEAGLGTA